MNYLETLKNITKDKNKRIENLVLLVILLVIMLISISYIFKGNSEQKNLNISNSTSSTSNTNSSNTTSSKENMSASELEDKLNNVLSQISGVSEVSVVLTYSKDTTTIPVYNTKEKQSSNETTSEKNVAYNEKNGDKTAIVQSVELPKVEGVIVVAKGVDNIEMKSKISTAISNLTDVPTYKIQVFEK